MTTIGRTIRELDPLSSEVQNDFVLAISDPSSMHPDIAYKVTVSELLGGISPDQVDAKSIRVDDGNDLVYEAQGQITIANNVGIVGAADYEKIKPGDIILVGVAPYSDGSTGTVLSKTDPASLNMTFMDDTVISSNFKVVRPHLFIGTLNQDLLTVKENLSRVLVGPKHVIVDSDLVVSSLKSASKVDPAGDQDISIESEGDLSIDCLKLALDGPLYTGNINNDLDKTLPLVIKSHDKDMSISTTNSTSSELSIVASGDIFMEGGRNVKISSSNDFEIEAPNQVKVYAGITMENSDDITLKDGSLSVSAGNIKTSSGYIEATLGDIRTVAGDIEASSGNIKAVTGDFSGTIDAGALDVSTKVKTRDLEVTGAVKSDLNCEGDLTCGHADTISLTCTNHMKAGTLDVGGAVSLGNVDAKKVETEKTTTIDFYCDTLSTIAVGETPSKAWVKVDGLGFPSYPEVPWLYSVPVAGATDWTFHLDVWTRLPGVYSDQSTTKGVGFKAGNQSRFVPLRSGFYSLDCNVFIAKHSYYEQSIFGIRLWRVQTDGQGEWIYYHVGDTFNLVGYTRISCHQHVRFKHPRFWLGKDSEYEFVIYNHTYQNRKLYPPFTYLHVKWVSND